MGCNCKSLFLFVLVSGLVMAIGLGIMFKDEERSAADICMHALYSFVFFGHIPKEDVRFDDGTHVEKMLELSARINAVAENMEGALAMDSSLYTDLFAPMSDGHENAVRVYYPPNYPDDPETLGWKTEKWPVLLWIHGGGFCIGNNKQNDPYLFDLAEKSNALIFSVQYRLAPEHPHPQAPNDILDHYLWLRENLDRFHGDVDRMGVAGESAGGTLAAVLTQDLRNLAQKGERVGSLKAQILTAPVADGNLDTDSYHKYGYLYGLTRQVMFGFLACYAGVDFEKIKDPRVFPLQGDLSSLPPAVVILSNHDPLLDGGMAYAKGLKKAGVPTEFHVLEGTHVSATAFPYFFHQEQYQTTLSATARAIQSM